jgi:hypothetical protein
LQETNNTRQTATIKGNKEDWMYPGGHSRETNAAPFFSICLDLLSGFIGLVAFATTGLQAKDQPRAEVQFEHFFLSPCQEMNLGCAAFRHASPIQNGTVPLTATGINNLFKQVVKCLFVSFLQPTVSS